MTARSSAHPTRHKQDNSLPRWENEGGAPPSGDRSVGERLRKPVSKTRNASKPAEQRAQSRRSKDIHKNGLDQS